ncbi:MAG: ABC transporter permease [Actinomycetota bacterium]
MSTTTERLRSRQQLPTLIGALLVALLVGYVVVAGWRTVDGQSWYEIITWDNLVRTLVVGVTTGSIYAIAASGLVVTYTTSGIFNFAQGAMGMFCAYVYWTLKVDWGVPSLVSVVVTVLLFAPLFGAAVERVLMRRLADAPLVAKLVVTIGLMVALMGLAVSIWKPNVARTIPSFYGTDGFDIGSTFVPWYRLITILTGLLLAVVIRVVLYRTRLGVAMRAVVDQRDLAALNGARPGRTSAFAWGLGTSMAALAGIFLAEELSNLSVETLTLFIVNAFAAAIIGRLKSLPWTYVGGMIIGIAIAFQANFLTWHNGSTGEISWGLPFFVIPTGILFVALLFVPQARIEGRQVTSKVTPRIPTLRRASVGLALLFGFMVVNAAYWDRIGIRNLTLVILYAFLMLSLVPLTGWSGQISLAQITFAGVGAFAMVKVAGSADGWWIIPGGNGAVWALIVAALLAIPFGVLIALPTVRLQGLYLALATMAFAILAQQLFFEQAGVFGTGGKRIPPIQIFGFGLNEPFTLLGIEFGEDAAMLLFSTAMFCIVGFGVVALRRSGYGRRLIALRDSPAASATLGVNLFGTKLVVFALSAAIAGFAGALNGAYLGSASTPDFAMLNGLPILLLAVVGGVSIVSGVVFGAFALQSFAWLVELFPARSFPTLNDLLVYWQRIGPGLAGIGIGRSPDGAVVEIGAAVRGERKGPGTPVGSVSGPGEVHAIPGADGAPSLTVAGGDD